MDRSPSTLHSIAHSPGPMRTSSLVAPLLASTGTDSGVADQAAQLPPVRPPLADLGQQGVHLLRRGDVLAGQLAGAELPGVDAPAHQVGQLVDELLGDERLDDLPLHEPQVDQQLAQPPADQLAAALDLQRLGQGLGREDAGGDQPRADQRTAAGDEDRVDQPVPEVDLGLVLGVVHDVQAAGRPLRPEVQQHLLKRTGQEVAVEHADPPSQGRPPWMVPQWISVPSAASAGLLSPIREPVAACG